MSEGHHDEGMHFPAHHFDTADQQLDSNKLGMWLFLATEILLFAGLFCAYAVYRSNHPEIFVYAHYYLDTFWGAVNTIVLIVSSFTMAWGVRAAQLGQRHLATLMMVLTLLCACGFLVIKYIEYEHKFHDGLLPGTHFLPAKSAMEAKHAKHGDDHGHDDHGDHADHGHDDHGHGDGHGKPWEDPDPDRPRNVQIFFGIYFCMTGLHGIHVLAGMAAIGWVLWRNVRGHFNKTYNQPVELVGLYWHIVDLIWIYLFPLLYLIH